MRTATSKAVGVFGRLHGRPLDGVPRWAVLSAYGASLTVLPSCIWRIALGFGAPLGPLSNGDGDARGDVPSWVPLWAYAFLLSILSEGLALLAIGLVSRWGEEFPRWIPLLGGRRVPTPAAVIPAGLGAAILTVATLAWLPSFNTFKGPDGASLHLGGWKLAAFVVSYGPLLAWGPLLGIVTVAYYLRRRAGKRFDGSAVDTDHERSVRCS